MKTYRLLCFWQECATVEIDADSLEEAIEIVESDEYPLPDGLYCDGTFEVDKECAYSSYPNDDDLDRRSREEGLTDE